MKKKGFTLIELLAVIVILAIITVIAVPKILDVIEKSRRSASEQSVKLYVDAFRLYQANADLNNTDKIPEGIYEVSKETTLNGKIYKKINDLLTMKGNKPSAGTINVTNTGKIGTAKVCINNYVISYQEGSTSVLADDCGDMDLFVDFKINTDDWATEKTLTIVYPEKQGYKKYFKVESGSVFIGEKEVTSESAQEVTEKEITLKLKENSKVSAWLEKNSKKAGISTYEEKKIDNEELVEPTITLTGSYPTFTEYGVQMSVSLKLSNEKNKTSKIMYRVDNGEFKKYTGEINVTGSKIDAKTVKPNGRESSIAEKDMSGVEVAKDAIGSEAFDNDLNTYITMNRYNDYADAVKEPYLLVDKSMQRQKFTIRGKTASDTGNIIVYYYDNNDNLLSHEDIEKQFDGEKDCTIPINTTKIRFSKYYTWTEAYIYEIYPSYNSSIKIVKNYPTLTKNGITGKSFNAIISYSSKAILKQYKIDNGEWKNYSGEIKNITAGSTIYARSKVSNVEKEYITSVTPDFPNAISDSVYDNDLNTYITMNRYNDYADAVSEPYLLVDKSMQGQKFIVRGKSESSTGNLFVYYYNDADELLGHEYAEHQFDGEKEFTIPSNATRIRFSKYYTYTNSYIYEIYPKTN